MTWRSRQPAINDEALLVALGKRLRNVAGAVEPRADFRSSLRTSLVMEAETALVPGPSAAHVRAARATRVIPRRRMVIASAVVATLLGLGSMASASASALPGEMLYPIKRANEQLELTFHRDLADRGAFQLELAERRLVEAHELSERGPEFADLATETLREFEVEVAAGTADLMEAYSEGNARGSLVVLNNFTDRTDELLDDLASQLPAEALEDARDQLKAIDSSSEQLCSTCGGGSDADPPTSAAPEGSEDSSPEPEPEPAEPPRPEEPVEPALPVPAPATTSSDDEDESDEQEEDDEEDSDDDSDSESDEPDPPTPTPTPTPTPDPTPTPTPDPTDPPAPDVLEGVGDLVGDTLDGVL